MTYVYRLHITYPEGSRREGWHPQGWEPDVYLHEEGWRPFSWPQEREFLSRSGADHRAGVLRGYGARVTIEQSKPVQWPSIEEALATLQKRFARLQAQVPGGES